MDSVVFKFCCLPLTEGDQQIFTLQRERRTHFCRAAGLTVLGFWLLEASTINCLWASKAFLTILTWQKESTEHTRSFTKQLTPNQLKQHFCQMQLHVHRPQKRIWLERDSNPWPAILVQRYFIYSFVFTFYRYITNSQCDQLPYGLIGQLVEHSIGITEVMGSNPV